VRSVVAYRMARAVLTLVFLCSLAGCAGTVKPSAAELPAMHTVAEFRDLRFAYVPDPWEGFNRSMYRFNYYLDKYLFLPVVSGYEFVTPVVLQTGVSNFYNNLGRSAP